jgi:LmbE family N-acetylglucosaminyl deacetylase
MAVIYILAHFDDEYAALPMIWAARRAGLEQRFFYVADYVDPAMASRRLAESRRFLAAQGIDGEAVTPLKAGALDGAVHRSLPAVLAALRRELAGVAVDALVAPAWEGGHMDHDTCASLATQLASELGDPPIRQFSLYNGIGLPGMLLHGAAPLRANGPVERMRLSPGEWLRWAAAVRWFPSQYYAWAGIWPAMMWTLARRGFGWQRLTAARVAERPHAGPLFYERMFKVDYVEVRAALDSLNVGSSAT